MAAAKQQSKQAPAPAPQSGEIAVIQPPRLPYHPAVEERFGIAKSEWKALVEAIFPLATSVDAIILALSYCKARRLDPFKRNVHIVPIWNKQLGRMVDTVWPGIGELRTTAFRTGQYAGRAETIFGRDIEMTFKGKPRDNAAEQEISLVFPEWAQVTVCRLVANQRVEFVGPRVYWLETYSTIGKSDLPNEMWQTRPRGQLDKCAEAAALRVGFPEEIGSDYIAEEAGHRRAGAETSIIAETQERGAAGLAKRLGSKRDDEPIEAEAREVTREPEHEGGDEQKQDPDPRPGKDPTIAPAGKAPEFSGKGADDARKAWGDLSQKAYNATGAEGESLAGIVEAFIAKATPESREEPYMIADLANGLIRKTILDAAANAAESDWKDLQT